MNIKHADTRLSCRESAEKKYKEKFNKRFDKMIERLIKQFNRKLNTTESTVVYLYNPLFTLQSTFNTLNNDDNLKIFEDKLKEIYSPHGYEILNVGMRSIHGVVDNKIRVLVLP